MCLLNTERSGLVTKVFTLVIGDVIVALHCKWNDKA